MLDRVEVSRVILITSFLEGFPISQILSDDEALKNFFGRCLLEPNPPLRAGSRFYSRIRCRIHRGSSRLDTTPLLVPVSPFPPPSAILYFVIWATIERSLKWFLGEVLLFLLTNF